MEAVSKYGDVLPSLALIAPAIESGRLSGRGRVAASLGEALEAADADYVTFVDEKLVPANAAEIAYSGAVLGTASGIGTADVDATGRNVTEQAGIGDALSSGSVYVILSSEEAVELGILKPDAPAQLMRKSAECDLDMLLFGDPRSSVEYCGLFTGQQFYIKTQTHDDGFRPQCWPPLICTSFLQQHATALAKGIEAASLQSTANALPAMANGQAMPEPRKSESAAVAAGRIAFGVKCIALAKRVMADENPFALAGEFDGYSLATAACAPGQLGSAGASASAAPETPFAAEATDVAAVARRVAASVGALDIQLEGNFRKCLSRRLFDMIVHAQERIWNLDEPDMFRIAGNMDFAAGFDLFLMRNTIARWKFEEQVASRDARIAELESSTSMRVGTALTTPLRKLRDSKRASSAVDADKPAAAPTSPAGLTVAKRSPQVIASFTSYPMRLDTIGPTVESLAGQTEKFDRIVLWLARSQFPDGQLPKSMKRLFDMGLEVMWCDDDIRSYKRSVCAFRTFPDDVLVFFDDDLVYEPHSLEKLLRSYDDHPNAINALRVRQMHFDTSGALLPYNSWEVVHSERIGEPRMDLLATNGAGTLYPPHTMPPETLDASKFLQLAPTADDIWLKFMQVIADMPVVLASEFDDLEYTDGTQDVCALWDDNEHLNLNDVSIANLLAEYNEIHGPADTLLARMQRI